MPHLRPTAIAGLLLALVPAAATLSSCGFDYPTDRVNTIAAGKNNRDHSVDALGIRVLASAQGEGRLIGALANNNDDEASLDSVSSPEGIVEAATFKPIEVAGRGTVNLASLAPIDLTGDFTAGDVVTLDLTFSTGETATLDVPVVKNCFQYTQVPTPTAEAEEPEAEKPEAGEGETAEDETAGAVADEEGQEVEGHADGDHEEEGGDASFNCADEAPVPGDEH
ncbi:MAG TPA: hypothetical protein VNS46_21625 [Nocardioides sp.]|nr:hypothetical protein [Nocardioides sp.]